MKHREAVAAVILHKGKFLCVRKGEGKHAYDAFKYEFPGGKTEKDETQEEAVAREVMEELQMNISVREKLMVVDHEYPGMHITMHVFRCSCKDPQVTLTEHIEYQWLEKDRLGTLDWADAEWKIVEYLLTDRQYE